jgi:hypothetical protein
MGKVKPQTVPSKWPRHFRTFWCVSDSRGTAYLVSVRINRTRSIVAFLEDAES